MEDYFEIGKVVGTHGIKGTFRVYPLTDDPKRFELLKNIDIVHNGKIETFKLSKVSYHKKFVLLTFKEINDINVTLNYKDDIIVVHKDLAIPLEEDEYYTKDLYDIDVYTDEDEFLGVLKEIYYSPANDIYAVFNEDTKKELLIPAIKQCILKVSVSENKMTVKLLDGLRD